MGTSLASIDQVKAYLDAESIPYTSIRELSGGYANFVYLVTQPSGPGRVIKHTLPVVRAFPTIPAPIARAACEVRALTVLPPLLPTDPAVNVHIPTLIRYDAEAHAQHQEPAGARTLKDAYQDSKLDIPAIGRRMGQWVAALHALKVPAEFEDSPTARRLSGSSYRGAPGTLERWGLDPAPARVALEQYAPLLLTEDQNLCHGDFWSGNVLLPEGAEGSPRLSMVDWEMSRPGNGATDVGQFSAEAWLLDHHRGGRGLLPSFLEGYCEATGTPVTKEFIQRTSIHAGVHLAYWPSMVSWADEEGTKKIFAFGSELAKEGERGDLDWLKGSIFGPLAKDVAI